MKLCFSNAFSVATIGPPFKKQIVFTIFVPITFDRFTFMVLLLTAFCETDNSSNN